MRQLQVNNKEYSMMEMSYGLKLQVLQACKIVVSLGLDSGPFGNISMRIPNTNIFCINPAGKTFDQLKLQDIICVNTEGNVLDSVSQAHPGAFIHKEIYLIREDVNAIVHTHSANTVLISLLGCPIEPFTQLGAAIYDDQSMYHGYTGPVRTTDEGNAIATALANKSIVIAKNHGVFTTAGSMQAALWDMVVTDLAANIHLEARKLGIEFAEKLTDEYMQKSKIEVRDKQCDDMWQSYLEKIA